jgi:hypothetical protein
LFAVEVNHENRQALQATQEEDGMLVLSIPVGLP